MSLTYMIRCPYEFISFFFIGKMNPFQRLTTSLSLSPLVAACRQMFHLVALAQGTLKKKLKAGTILLPCYAGGLAVCGGIYSKYIKWHRGFHTLMSPINVLQHLHFLTLREQTPLILSHKVFFLHF